MSKTKLPRLPKRMSNGELKALHKDFAACFADVETFTAEDLAQWAINTRQFYDWFYTRFERMADEFNAKGIAYALYKEYRPAFFEWAPWETHPCKLADALRGCLNAAKLSCNEDSMAGKIIYAHYLKTWEEQRKPRFNYVKLFFIGGKGCRYIFFGSKESDEYLRGRFAAGKKWEDRTGEMTIVEAVQIFRDCENIS